VTSSSTETAERAVNLTKALVKIDSVTGNERRIGEFIAGYLGSNGIEARTHEVEGRLNVYARIGADAKPALLLTGHVDTVPTGSGWTRDPFGAEEEGGRIYGRGACDMKSGLAAIMAAMIDANRIVKRPSRSLAFAAVIDEENTGTGTKAALRDGIDARYAIIAEPTELQPICAAKGNCYLRIEVAGKAAHAGFPELGVNAIAAAARLVEAMEDYNATLAMPMHPLLGRRFATVTRITGGSGDSIVPQSCRLSIDRRMLPHETGAYCLADLRRYLQSRYLQSQAALEGMWGYEVSLDMELPGMEIAVDHPLVRLVEQASRSCGGPALPAAGWSAASDGGLLAAHGAIETVLYGPGSIVREAHRADESVPIGELSIAADAYLAIATKALRGDIS